MNSAMGNGFLSGNWVNPASISPAVTSAFGDIGFLAVAGQSFGGMNPALFSGATAPAAMGAAGLSQVGSAMGALGSPGFGGSAVSAGVGRATLVGTMSVPQSWAAATPAASHAATASPAEGWYNPARDRGSVRDTRSARHAGNAVDGRRGRTRRRVGLCCSPLRVPSHRRRASAGCRMTEGSHAVSFRPTTTRMRRRSWHRIRRPDPPCREPSPRRCLFRAPQSTQRTAAAPLYARVIYQQPQPISTTGASPANRGYAPALTRYRQSCPRVGLTTVPLDGTIADASTSLGEASARI